MRFCCRLVCDEGGFYAQDMIGNLSDINDMDVRKSSQNNFL